MTNAGFNGFPSTSGAVPDGAVTAGKLAVPLGWGSLTSGYYFTCSPHTSGASTLGNGTLRLTPCYIPNVCTLTRIGAEVTINGDVGSKFRLGVYADNGSGYPGALVLDAGTIAGDSNTVQEITINQALTPGLYWFGGATQVVSSVSPTLKITAAPANIPLMPIGASAPSAGLVVQGYQQASVTGALPAKFTATVTTGTAGPRTHIKVA